MHSCLEITCLHMPLVGEPVKYIIFLIDVNGRYIWHVAEIDTDQNGNSKVLCGYFNSYGLACGILDKSFEKWYCYNCFIDAYVASRIEGGETSLCEDCIGKLRLKMYQQIERQPKYSTCLISKNRSPACL